MLAHLDEGFKAVDIDLISSEAEPLNLVIIGALDDWTTAFTRRGYRYQVLNPRYAFGRVQGLSGQKLSRGYRKGQELTIRIWQTPIRYHGKPVWVAQTSGRRGGTFCRKGAFRGHAPLESIGGRGTL